MNARVQLMTTVDEWALAWRELNDSGNADRFVVRAGGLLAHVREWGWVAFDGKRWSTEDGQRLALLKAMEVARAMRDEIDALAAPDDRDLPEWCSPDMRADRVVNLRKHAVSSGNSNKTKAMLDQAASLDILNRRLDGFDEDRLTINCANETVRFVQDADGWKLRRAPHDPADLLTRVTTTDFVEGARSARWEQHMETVLPDGEVRRYFQKMMGYCATGLTREQVFILLQGKGGDGKSTTMNVLRIVMGSYAVVGNVKTFIDGQQRAAGDTTPELIRFVGDTRLISLQEPKRGQAMAEERVKQFTGGSPVTARANYGDEFEFDPRGKVVMEVNARPRISGDDDGIWRRIVIILFPHQFKGSDNVKGYTERLLEEREGVLQWLLEGVRLYLEEGLEQPQAVAAAIEEYRRSANPFSEWMASRCDLSDPSAVTGATALFQDYKTWCEAENVSDRDMMNSTQFGRALGDRQLLLGPRTRDGKKTRRGIRLRGSDGMLEGSTGADAPAASSAPATDTAWPGVDEEYTPGFD